MNTENNELPNIIFSHIEELFTDCVGPIATILCEEALDEWKQELSDSGKRVSIKSLPLYIEKLAIDITNPSDKEEFLKAVYDIEAIRAFNR